MVTAARKPASAQDLPIVVGQRKRRVLEKKNIAPFELQIKICSRLNLVYCHEMHVHHLNRTRLRRDTLALKCVTIEFVQGLSLRYLHCRPAFPASRYRDDSGARAPGFRG